MPTTSQIEVSKLKLDLKNFRTVPQKKESDAIKAMISIKPDRFFAVMDSADHGLSMTKSGGKDKTLVEVLRGITAHLTNNNSNTQMIKVLHGAMTELGKPDGLLSVTSMNNLVHSPVFTISQSDLCTVFSNIYPLLEAMN